MDNQSFLTKSADETQDLAKKIIEKLFESSTSSKHKNNTCILLNGPLGSGKTTFSKGIAKSLGITETIKSPTYTYHNDYSFKHNDENWTLIHFDLYRLPEHSENPSQVSAEIGLEEALKNPRSLVLIEWPKRLPISHYDLSLTFSVEDGGHKIQSGK